jgi:hypothetical protein
MSSDILGDYWADLIGLALTLVLVNGAISGKFYTHGRGGGRRLIAFVKSSSARVGFLLVAAGLVVWLVVDLRHKLGAQ